MKNDEKLEALLNYVKSLHQSIEVLETQVSFLEQCLPAEVQDEYQRYIYQYFQTALKDKSSALYNFRDGEQSRQ